MDILKLEPKYLSSKNINIISRSPELRRRYYKRHKNVMMGGADLSSYINGTNTSLCTSGMAATEDEDLRYKCVIEGEKFQKCEPAVPSFNPGLTYWCHYNDIYPSKTTIPRLTPFDINTIFTNINNNNPIDYRHTKETIEWMCPHDYEISDDCFMIVLQALFKICNSFWRRGPNDVHFKDIKELNYLKGIKRNLDIYNGDTFTKQNHDFLALLSSNVTEYEKYINSPHFFFICHSIYNYVCYQI